LLRIYTFGDKLGVISGGDNLLKTKNLKTEKYVGTNN